MQRLRQFFHTPTPSDESPRPVLIETNSYRRFALSLLFADLGLLAASLYSIVSTFLQLDPNQTPMAIYIIGGILAALYACTLTSHLRYVRVSAHVDATGSALWHARIGADLLLSITLLSYTLCYAFTLHLLVDKENFSTLAHTSTVVLLGAAVVYKLTVLCVALKHWSTLKSHINTLQEHIVEMQDAADDVASVDAPPPVLDGCWTQLSLSEPSLEEGSPRFGTVRRRGDPYIDSPRRIDDAAMGSEQQRFLLGDESETRF